MVQFVLPLLSVSGRLYVNTNQSRWRGSLYIKNNGGLTVRVWWNCGVMGGGGGGGGMFSIPGTREGVPFPCFLLSASLLLNRRPLLSDETAQRIPHQFIKVENTTCSPSA